MLEARLQSGQIVSFDGRVLEIFQPSQPSGRYHVDQLSAPALSEKADGGCELMLACDLVVAAEDAKLGIAEVKRGLFAAGGGTTLADRIPLAIALEMGLTGEPVTAARAQEIGLVNRVVPADRVLAEARAMAQQIAANGPLGVAMTKKLMRERRWGEPAEVEQVFRSADAVEGARAFAERRPPVWTGK